MNVEALRQAMDRRGWTATDLAAESGVHASTISLILAGKRANSPAVIVARLALALGVSTDYLLGLTTDPAPKRTDLPRLAVELLDTVLDLPHHRQRDLLLIARTFGRDSGAQDVDQEFEQKFFDQLERSHGRELAEQVLWEWAQLLPGDSGQRVTGGTGGSG